MKKKYKIWLILIVLILFFTMLFGKIIFASSTKTRFTNFWDLVKKPYSELLTINIGDYCQSTISGIGRDYFPKSICIHPSTSSGASPGTGYMDVATIVDTIHAASGKLDPLGISIQEIGRNNISKSLSGTAIASYIGYWAETNYGNLDNWKLAGEDYISQTGKYLWNKHYQNTWKNTYATEDLPDSTNAWRQFMYRGEGSAWANNISSTFKGLIYDGYHYVDNVLVEGSYFVSNTNCYKNALNYEEFVDNNDNDNDDGFFIKGGILHTAKKGTSVLYENGATGINRPSFDNNSTVELEDFVIKNIDGINKECLELLIKVPVLPILAQGESDIINRSIVCFDNNANLKVTPTLMEEVLEGGKSTGKYKIYIDKTILQESSGRYNVKVTCTHNLYKARIFGLRVNSEQKNAIVTGCLMKHETSILFTKQALPNVTITKKVVMFEEDGTATYLPRIGAEPGEEVIFRVEVSNSGADTQIDLEDEIPNGLTLREVGILEGSGIDWSKTSTWSGLTNQTISNGNDIVIYLKCTVDSNAKNYVDGEGNITNTATVAAVEGYLDSDDPPNTEKTADAKVKILGYDYSIKKEANKSVYEYGEEVEYTITVTNEGSTYIQNIVVQDQFEEPILEGLSLKLLTDSGWTEDSGKYTKNGWSTTDGINFTHSGIILGGRSSSFTVTYTIPAAVNVSTNTNEVEINSKSVENTAKIIGITNTRENRETEASDYISILNYVDAEDRTSSKTININGYNYKIDKIVNTARAEAGDTLMYTIRVINIGANKIKNIKVTDALPTGLTDSKFSGSGWSNSGNDYTYANDINGSGGTAQFTITCTFGNGFIKDSNSNVTNRATVTKVTNSGGRGLITGIYSEALTTILGYNAELKKYISADRSSMSNEQKNNSPVVVKKGDTITYTIELKNTGGGTLCKPQIVDELPAGLEYKGLADSKKWSRGEDGKTYTYNGNVVSGDSIKLDIACKVTMSNMYLFNIENTATYGTVKNRNDIDTSSVLTLGNNKDYIRLDELDISGTVWEDSNKDGILESSESKISGIEVKLHSFEPNEKGVYEDKILATTTTNAEGKYTFTNVQKGLKRDTNGNYSNITGQGYKKYYIQFVYNGVTYESTKYADTSNINNDGSIKEAYRTDSNSAERTDLRGNFNNSLETISYNLAKGRDGTTQELTYTKDEKISTLNYTDNLEISAFSFVDTSEGYPSMDRLLWLGGDYTGDMSSHKVKENTDYLNYINLGLIKRDTFDLSLSNKVEEIETVVNGQSMKYNFSKINGINRYSLYNSDYYFRHDEIQSDLSEAASERLKEIISELKKYESSELNVFVTFKTTIRNHSKDTYAKVNEIAQFYDHNFETYGEEVTIGFDNDKDGVIENTETRGTTAYAKDKDGNDINITNIGTESSVGYNDKNLNGLKVLYVGTDYNLAPGEEIYIYITYIVDKDETRKLKIIEGRNGGEIDYDAQLQYISIIGQYSSYDDESASRAAGLIDYDSNPGNLGLKNTGENPASTKDVKSTEDETKKYDGKRYPQKYFEDDTYICGIQFFINNEGYERKLSGFTWEDVRNKVVEDGHTVGNGIFNENDRDINGKKDTPIKDITVQLVEIIKDGNDYYEVIRQDATSGADGKYTIEDFIPGNYIVRFKYGDKEETIEYSGQDYKSTTYTLGDSASYSELVKENISDARDDELRRLEVMNYSIEMYNEKAEILKGAETSNSEELIVNTNMFADTVQFFCDYELLINEEGSLIDADEIIRDSHPSVYKWTVKYETVEGGIVEAEYIRIHDGYTIKNIDFGIQERPISKVELEKYIKQIKLETSAGDLLVDLHYDENSALVESNSRGFENVQALDNTDTHQGFRYINVDEDLLQGAKITVIYGFKVINDSEVDHIGANLYGNQTTINNLNTAKALKEMDDAIKDLDNLDILLKNNYKYRNQRTSGAYYYGYYLGGIYYTGTKTDDVIATIKVDNILDYVDNSLVYNPIDNGGAWGTAMAQELINGGYLKKDVYTFVQEDGTTIEMIADIQGIKYQTDTKNNLAVTIDDPNLSTLSKQLYPNGAGESTATTELMVSTFLSSENESDDMVYENIAEIIKFTTLTGRRTISEQIVGNAKVYKAGYKGDDSTLGELDTSITEKIMLTPPTGGDWIDTYVLTRVIIYVVGSIAVIVLGILFIPKLVDKIKNRKFIK